MSSVFDSAIAANQIPDGDRLVQAFRRSGAAVALVPGPVNIFSIAANAIITIPLSTKYKPSVPVAVVASADGTLSSGTIIRCYVHNTTGAQVTATFAITGPDAFVAGGLSVFAVKANTVNVFDVVLMGPALWAVAAYLETP